MIPPSNLAAYVSNLIDRATETYVLCADGKRPDFNDYSVSYDLQQLRESLYSPSEERRDLIERFERPMPVINIPLDLNTLDSDVAAAESLLKVLAQLN